MTTIYRTENDYPDDIRRVRLTLVREMGRDGISWADRLEAHDALVRVNRHAMHMAAESRHLEPETWGPSPNAGERRRTEDAE